MLSLLRQLIKHPFIVASIVASIAFYIMVIIIEHKNETIKVIKQEAKMEVVKSVTNTIHKHAERQIRKINELDINETNLSGNSGTISFDGLFN